jgi:hypothetical protein
MKTQTYLRECTVIRDGHEIALALVCKASGPEMGLPGRIAAGVLIGKTSKSDRPKAGRRADFEALPTGIRPKSGPEARVPARKHWGSFLLREALDACHTQGGIWGARPPRVSEGGSGDGDPHNKAMFTE